MVRVTLVGTADGTPHPGTRGMERGAVGGGGAERTGRVGKPRQPRVPGGAYSPLLPAILSRQSRGPRPAPGAGVRARGALGAAGGGAEPVKEEEVPAAGTRSGLGLGCGF